jgi:hypothetical protein
MRIVKLSALFTGIHLLLIITLFMTFGLGLEGKHSLGHDVLWLVLEPGASIGGPWFLGIVLSSVVWGFICAMILTGVHHFVSK